MRSPLTIREDRRRRRLIGQLTWKTRGAKLLRANRNRGLGKRGRRR